MKPMVLMCMGLLAAFLCGCSGVQSPTARVVGFSVQEVTDEGVRGLVELELRNPNDTPLPLTKADYSVSLGQLGTQTYHDKLAHTIPAEGKQMVLLPAAWATGGNLAGQRDLAISGSVTYQPPGEVREVLTESKIPLPSVNFSGRGVIELAMGASWTAPRQAAPEPKIENTEPILSAEDEAAMLQAEADKQRTVDELEADVEAAEADVEAAESN